MTELTGRQAECGVLGRLAAAVRAGESRALVVRGEPGVGKTALLEYLADQASGCRVVRAAGVQSEMELAFAVLHQLCAPMLDRLERLPAPQRDALRIAFGLSPGPPPDRFLIGLAALGLLSELAGERPLVCIIDDEQWLDSASAQVLAFLARRLGTESVGVVFGARIPTGDLAGLPELVVEGLPEDDARVLLDSALTGPLDARVRDQVIAEAHGNPLALLELPRGWTAAELAGGFGLPGGAPVPGGTAATIEENFRRRIGALPAGSRRLLLLAAADPTGDPALVWRAAGRLGVGAESAAPAVEGGLAQFDVRVQFRHPLVRSAAYQSASAQDRQAAHRTLAEVTDPELDPDRRAWHRAQAAPEPDEDVAGELERSAGRAQARGGLAAAAAFGERGVMLTPDLARRAGRALAAANTKFQAGAFGSAQDLLAVAEAGPLSEFEQARVDLLRAQLAFVTNRGGDAPLLLVRAARRLEPIDPGLARATYLDALTASTLAGRLASPGGHTLEVARAASAAPPPDDPRVPDLLLDGLAANFNEGYAAGVPFLRQALTAFGRGMSADEELRWLWLTTLAALHLWDDERWDILSARYVELARKAGALSELPLALSTRSMMLLFVGDVVTATALTDEGRAVIEATGSQFAPYAAMGLAALQGRQATVSALIEATASDVAERGEGIAMSVAEWANALLHNGLGRYREAMRAAQQALDHQEYPGMRYPGIANWAAAELVEASARSGMTEIATATYRWIAEMTSASGTSWALGVEARSRALVTEGNAAESRYQDAITHLGRSRVRAELARAHLLYGEWLRRRRRRGEAREQLRTALDMLEAMGMEAFAERTRRELRATGETARKRTAAAGDEELTVQEAQIARLAREGLSNPEIGARLFLSPRTVQYHLGNVFAKLGITSRSQLGYALP